MKRLLSTAAVVAALSTPALAADITIGGDFEWSFKTQTEHQQLMWMLT